MSLELFLNELSFSPLAANERDANSRMEIFVRAVTAANTAAGSQLPLRAPATFSDLEIAPDYRLSRWRNSADVSRDIRQYFNRRVTQFPLFRSQADQDNAMGIEAKYGGQTASGLLAAYLNDGLVVSLDTDPRWDTSYLDAEISELDEQLGITCRSERCRHFSTKGHIDLHHRPWIRERAASQDDIWAWCGRLQSLDFCERVERQLRNFGANSPKLRQIRIRLQRLDDWWTRCCAERSDPFTGQYPAPRTLTTESEPTLRRFGAERTFQCPDGNQRVFKWHIRFTPGDGRIYFHLPDGHEKIIIGHVGDHLPTVQNPH